MQAGALYIEMSMNLARLAKDMADAKSTVGAAMSAIDKQVAAVKNAFVGLAAGLSVTALAGFLKGAIEAAAQMRNLSVQAGIAVEALSGLVAVGKATGTSADMIAAASNKLSKALATSNEESQGAARALKALGLDFDGFQKMKPEDRMKAIAVAMGQFEDGGQKSAAAMLLFGKAGAEMLPFLKDLATSGELNAKISTAQAEAAHEFETQLAKLKTQSEAWKKHLAMELLPTLNDILDALLSIKGASDSKESSLLGEALITVFQTLSVLGVNFIYVLKEIGRTIGGVAAAGVALVTGSGIDGRLNGFANALQGMKIDSANARVEVDKLSLSLLGILNSKAGAGRGGNTYTDPRVLGIPTKDQITGLQGSGKAAKEAETEYAKLMKTVSERIAQQETELKLGRDMTEFEKFETKVLADIDNAKKQLTETEKAAIASKLKEAEATQLTLEIQRSEIKQAHDLAVARQSQRNSDYEQSTAALRDIAAADAASLKSVNDRIQSLKDEADADQLAARLNVTLAEAVEMVTMARLAEKQAKFVEGSEGFEAVQKEIDARKELLALVTSREQLTALRDQWHEVDQVGHDVFSSLFEAGGNAFKKLGNILKTSLIDLLYQLTARQWIFQIFGNVTGAAANGAVQGGSSALIGAGGSAIGSSVGSLFGAGAGATMQNGLISGFGANMTNIGTLVEGGSYMTALSAAMPYLAIAGVAATLLSKIFSGGGGPKVESGYAPGGMTVATDPAWDHLWANGQRGDPSAAMQISQAIGSSYSALATQLGLLNKQLDVGVFFAKDPQGDSLTQLQIATNSYNRSDRLGGVENVGRSDADLQAAIAEETTRVIFNALKASELPDLYKGWLNAVAADANTSDMVAAIDHVTKAKTERAQLEAKLFDLTATDLEKLNKQREAERAAIDPSNASILEEIYRQQDLKTAADAAAAAAGDATAAVSEMSDTMKRLTSDTASLQVQLLQALGNNGGADFLQRQIDTAGMTEAERAVYDYNAALRAQIKAVTDAAAAAQAAAAREQQIAQQRYGLETRILQLQGNTAALRQRELAALEPANRALQQYIYTLEDLTAAQDAATAAHTAVDTARQTLLSAYQAEESQLTATIQRTHDFTASLRAFKDSLLIGQLSPLTPAEKYAETLRQFNAAKSSGDAAQIQSAATAFLEASRVYNASGPQYTADFNMVQQALTSLAGSNSSQSTTATAQLAAIRQQITLLGGIDTHTVSITSALATYTQAIINAAAADAAVTQALANSVIAAAAAGKGGTGTGTGGGTGGTGGTTTTLTLSDSSFYSMVYALLSAGDLKGAYDFTKTTGRTLADLDASMGWPAMTAEDWATANGYAVYHSGINSVPRDGFAYLQQGERVTSRARNVGGDSADELTGRIDSLIDVVAQGVRAQIQSNFAANDRAAERVVEGTEKATSRAAWLHSLERDAQPS